MPHLQRSITRVQDADDVDITGIDFRYGLTWDGSKFVAQDKLMRWWGDWQVGRTYNVWDVVVDGIYTMVANKQTDDRPAPQSVGQPYSIIDAQGPYTWESTSIDTNALITGQRYTAAVAGYITSVGMYVDAADPTITMALWLVSDPEGSPTYQVIIPAFTPTEEDIGWIRIPVGNILVAAGVSFDLVIMSSSIGGATDWNANWQVNRSNGDPVAGEANHQSGGSELRIHHTDADAGDQSTALGLLQAGDVFTMAGITYSILDASTAGSVTSLTVTPTTRPSSGLYNLAFTTYASIPIFHDYVTDHFLGNTEVQGIRDDDGNYPIEPGDLDNNAYAVDIEVQEAYISPDWDFLAVSGGAGGGGGGEAPDLSAYLRVTGEDTAAQDQDQIFTNGIQVGGLTKVGNIQPTVANTPIIVQTHSGVEIARFTTDAQKRIGFNYIPNTGHFEIQTNSGGRPALIARATSFQTADIAQFVVEGGTLGAGVNAGGRFFGWGLDVEPNWGGYVGAVIKAGSGGQTTNYIEVRDTTDTLLWYVDKDGLTPDSGGGGGLSPTGSDIGATDQIQVFTQGIKADAPNLMGPDNIHNTSHKLSVGAGGTETGSNVGGVYVNIIHTAQASNQTVRGFWSIMENTGSIQTSNAMIGFDIKVENKSNNVANEVKGFNVTAGTLSGGTVTRAIGADILVQSILAQVTDGVAVRIRQPSVISGGFGSFKGIEIIEPGNVANFYAMYTDGRIHHQTAFNNITPLTVKTTNGTQAANLIEVRNSADAVIWYVAPDGSTPGGGGGLSPEGTDIGATAQIQEFTYGVRIKGPATPATNLFEVRDNADSILYALDTNYDWWFDKGTGKIDNIFIGPGVIGSGNIDTASGSIGIGNNALKELTTGINNLAIGHGAGDAITYGSRNIAIGYDALRQFATGNDNIGIGNSANGNTSRHYGIGIGSSALGGNATGAIALGYQSGIQTSGAYGIFIGYRAGYGLTTGAGNICIGHQTGYGGGTGIYNTFLGYRAGYTGVQSFNTKLGALAGYGGGGDNNTFIGNRAGYSANCNYSIIIGNYAGYTNTVDNKLIIHNADASNPIIDGTMGAGGLMLMHAQDAGNPVLRLKLAASHTGNAFEIVDSNDVVLFSIDASGTPSA